MRMQRWKQEHMNLKIQTCKDPRIQASVHKHKDVRMRGYKPVKYIKHVGFFQVSPQSIHTMTNYVCISRYVYVSNGIYLLIFWCTINQTLPPKNHYSPLAWTCHQKLRRTRLTTEIHDSPNKKVTAKQNAINTATQNIQNSNDKTSN